ncbi:hypothetical protein JD844_014271 [Phrynosoma platyrhinos]|uniref:Cytochrome P450 1A n=1 Tax=Phrynosoma platyrhinos TaxID=52577 RepID=A0ABQ7SRB8_PHRPL|nr:hypothetical protein JD844_014271 [Phrynosoma platyrhinos]
MPVLEMSPLEGLGMITATEAFIATAVFLSLFIMIKSFWNQIPKGLKKIPGPVGYPLIGNILEMGKNPHLSLTKMSQKYGDVMMIHIGTTPVLVLSGLETIRQALVKQGTEFVGRPDLYSFRFIVNGQSLAFGHDSGEVWRVRRKMAQNALKSFAASPSPISSSTYLIEEYVSQEADYLIKKLQEVTLEKKSLDPFRYIVVSVANVMCGMCFGKRYSHDSKEFLKIVNESEKFVEGAASGNLVDFIPLLQYLPINKTKIFIEFNKIFDAFLLRHVKEHYESFSKDNIRDITDSFIEQSQGKVHISSESIVNLVNDLFGAERFLTADGKDIDKEESEKVLTFGMGKRRCIGEQIARWEVSLFLTTLLQELEFSVLEGVEVDMAPIYSLSMKHKRCPHFQVKQRSLKSTGQ